MAPRLQIGLERQAADLAVAAGRDVADHAQRLGRAEGEDQTDDADEPAQTFPPAVALAKATNCRALRACETGKLVASRSCSAVMRDLDPQRHTAQVGLVVRLTVAAGVG